MIIITQKYCIHISSISFLPQTERGGGSEDDGCVQVVRIGAGQRRIRYQKGNGRQETPVNSRERRVIEVLLVEFSVLQCLEP